MCTLNATSDAADERGAPRRSRPVPREPPRSTTLSATRPPSASTLNNSAGEAPLQAAGATANAGTISGSE